MKLIFKFTLAFLIFYNVSAFSREIILVENKASDEEGLLLKKILIKKFHLPAELITLKKIKQDCEKKSEAIIQLCLERDGELKIKQFNQYVVQNSLGIFLNSSDGVSE